MTEGGKPKLSPFFNFCRIEGRVILGSRKFDCGMFWKERLNDHFSRKLGSTRSSGYLSEKLEDLLWRPEIGDAQGGVSIENADERHRWEMKSLGNHLRADQDICFMGAELFEKIFVAIFLLCGVSVHAQCSDLRKDCMERALYMLCAESFEFERFGTLALRANSGRILRKIAKVALQEMACAMVG